MTLPTWLIWLSIAALAVALASAAYVLYDIVRCRRQMMTIMKWVWPITALYMGPIAIWAYRTLGLAGQQHQEDRGDSTEPSWRDVFKAVTHCGAGCTLGDIVGEWGIFIMGVTLAGVALWPEYIADFLLAYILGIDFQYFSIAPMRGLGIKDGLVAAVKADTLALTAFEVGLFGWMRRPWECSLYRWRGSVSLALPPEARAQVGGAERFYADPCGERELLRKRGLRQGSPQPTGRGAGCRSQKPVGMAGAVAAA